MSKNKKGNLMHRTLPRDAFNIRCNLVLSLDMAEPGLEPDDIVNIIKAIKFPDHVKLMNWEFKYEITELDFLKERNEWE